MRPEQKAALLAAKLRALVVEGWRQDASALETGQYLAGAAIHNAATGQGWVLVDIQAVDHDPDDLQPEQPDLPRGWLGAAVVWAIRKGVGELHILGDHLEGNHARWATCYKLPIQVWRVVGRTAQLVEPTAYIEPAVISPVAELFRETIVAAGAEPVVEHGVLRAEVLGLEVGRVVDDFEGIPQLEVGVGRHDRLAQAMMYGTAEVARSLTEAVLAVREHRRAGDGIHPANRLSPERWLRAVALQSPTFAGFEDLTAIESTEPNKLKRSTPALAVGKQIGSSSSLGANGDGGQTLAAFTVGVDLDAITVAADTLRCRGIQVDGIVLILPQGDDLPAVRAAADQCVFPVQVATISKDWREQTVGEK